MKPFPAVLLACTALMSLVMADPLLPVRRVPDEFRSLADLKSVRLNVAEVPPTLSIHGIDTEDIRSLWAKRLRGAGIEVTDDSLAPRLKVRLLGGSDPATPDSVAYVFTAELAQAVRVERIDDQKLVVPTYTDVFAGAGTTETVAKGMMSTANTAVKGFVKAVEEGTAARRRDLER